LWQISEEITEIRTRGYTFKVHCIDQQSKQRIRFHSTLGQEGDGIFKVAEFVVVETRSCIDIFDDLVEQSVREASGAYLFRKAA
jgi:hypothetical protein